MGDKTGIEWTDATWNPIRGCSKVSEGCRNCYAMSVAYRFSGPGEPYEGLAKQVNGKAAWTNRVVLVPGHISDPLKWRKPRRVFVNSMSDLFHPDVPDEWLDTIFGIMATARQHTFQVLTKRPERMAAYCRESRAGTQVLPNVWLGTSVEDQAAADERIPHLLATPAAVRFLSAEPLLGPLNLEAVRQDLGHGLFGSCLDWDHMPHNGGVRRPYPRIDWVITGGESGHDARPAHPDWFRSIRDQCHAAGVSYFHKQHKEYASPIGRPLHDVVRMPKVALLPDGGDAAANVCLPGVAILVRVGKKAAGRELDGRTWDEYPGEQRDVLVPAGAVPVAQGVAGEVG